MRLVLSFSSEFRAAFLTPKKTCKFEDFYTEWIDTLNTTLLPVLNYSNPEITAAFLASHVDRIHQHFQSYYTALDTAAISSPHQHLPLLLNPPWFSPLQVPFLFLGDVHPFLFTTLLRSFILDRDDDDEVSTDFDEDGGGSDIKSPDAGDYPEEHRGDGRGVIPDLQWRMAVARRRPSGVLISRMDEIERWVRLMVPDLTSRIRASQHRFAEWLAKRPDWHEDDPGIRVGEAKEAVGRAAEAEMKELVSVFVDANRLRRSVLAEIVSATEVYQAAGFFKALAQFLVGLRDKRVLEKLEECMVMLR